MYKKSTRKFLIVALAVLLLVGIASLVIVNVRADNAPVVDPIEDQTTATTVIEETQSTEPTVATEATESKNTRNNETTSETQPQQTPSNEPNNEPDETKPAETNPAETQPSETTPAPTEPQPTEPEVTVPAPTEHVHKYEVSKVVKATCCTSGYTTYVCNCGHAYNGDAVDPVAHEYDKTVVEPTVDAEGYTLNVCKNCGNTEITDRTAKLPAPAEETPAPTEPEATEPEHHHAEIVQGGVTYVFCTDVTTPYMENGRVYYPWSCYPY